jgi:hypothetical protein
MSQGWGKQVQFSESGISWHFLMPPFHVVTELELICCDSPVMTIIGLGDDMTLLHPRRVGAEQQQCSHPLHVHTHFSCFSPYPETFKPKK